MRFFLSTALLVFFTAARAATSNPPPLLLISLDGFRWDYCDLHPAETPRLHALMQHGVHTRELIPVFPSNTFPNHYSIVTGLYPAHHGIINNVCFDPRLNEFFHYNQAASAHDNRWWGGEPIWITAVKQGKRSASYFWPGSETDVNGVRPTITQPFDYSISFEKRLNDLVGWLQLPEDQRPAVIAFYLEETNSVGHNAGPDSPELAKAVQLLDGRVGAIVEALAAHQIAVNLLVVSDHGMTSLSAERVILLDDYIDLNTVQVDFEGPVAGLRPVQGDVESAIKALEKLPPLAKVYRAEDLPMRFHLHGSVRVPPIWVVADEGWHVDRRSYYNTVKNHFSKGEHGYDNALRSMHGIMIASGPSFKSDGSVIDPVENIHLYNLMCAAAGLTPAKNDGDDRLIKAVMKSSQP